MFFTVCIFGVFYTFVSQYFDFALIEMDKTAGELTLK